MGSYKKKRGGLMATQALAINESIASSRRAQVASILSGGDDLADTLHNVYADFGYPSEVSFFNAWNMYRRFGIAKNIVELYPDTCFKTNPKIEASSQFERELEIIITQHKLWQRLKGLDVRQRVGRYAGLFMRVRDGLDPSQPLEGGLNGIGALVQMIPLYESQLNVNEFDDDIMSDDYGMPKMYNFNGSISGSNKKNAFNIHPSRVVISSEGSDNGDIFGISSLEAPYNSLMDLRKIIGAGGEGFYKNASKDVIFNLQDASSAKVNKGLLENFNTNYDDWVRNRARRSLWTPGMEAKVLESNLADPKEFFMNALNDVGAASKIPSTILIGQQTGRLASDQDSSFFLSIAQARRGSFLNETITNVLTWFIKNGILPSSEFEIIWDDLLAGSKNDKLANAKVLSDINAQQFKSGEGTPFSGEEIREEGGFENESIQIERKIEEEPIGD